MRPLHPKRSELRLGYSVVPAVAPAAHRSRDAVLVQQLAEVLAGVLTAAITVEDRSPFCERRCD
jgi:hypothetical protein